MTYEGEISRSASRVLRLLVVLMIVWVAYWTSTGGLDQIIVPEDETTSSVAALL